MRSSGRICLCAFATLVVALPLAALAASGDSGISAQAKAGDANTNRVVEGGVFPISNDGVGDDGTEQTGYPMPFVEVFGAGNTTFTDAGGNLLACVVGPVTTNLSGPYLSVFDFCGVTSETTDGNVLDLGTSAGTDCAVPPGASPGNTHASRTGFYELNRTIEWGRSHLPNNAWVRQPLPATMNLDANCAAAGGADGVLFVTSGDGCSNTGELAAVLVHEWGHGMDESDAAPGFSNPGEGIADVYASLRLNTSCIGRNFRPGSTCTGYGDPCLFCTGIRDIDWANRASGTPHGISGATGIDALCGVGGAPCGGRSHCEGAAFAESVWDLWNRDLPAVYGMSLDTARELVTRLNFVGSGAVTNYFSCVDGTGIGDGCNVDSGYLQFLAADDDDGDLANGTPHMTAIFNAFDRHEIACPTPKVIDSGCTDTPAVAPVVTATPLDRGVELTWPAVAGAASYRVFRTEGVHGCDFGKIWVGETTTTSFIDSELKNGQEHYYIVTAMGSGDSCFGPASSCTPVTPAPGETVDSTVPCTDRRLLTTARSVQDGPPGRTSFIHTISCVGENERGAGGAGSRHGLQRTNKRQLRLDLWLRRGSYGQPPVPSRRHAIRSGLRSRVPGYIHPLRMHRFRDSRY